MTKKDLPVAIFKTTEEVMDALAQSFAEQEEANTQKGAYLAPLASPS